MGGSKCHAQGVGANLDIDVNALTNTIIDTVVSVQNREGFVQSALAQAFEQSGRRYNVVVCNMSLKPDFTGLQGVQYFETFNYSGVPYGVWVFESGKFVKPGDGGYINWAYVGYNAERTYGPDTVTFSKP
jgi:hypothetical protein